MTVDNTFIAVVEDDPEIRDLTVGLLSREGYEVAPCENVAVFERLVARRRVDLVLLDIMLPGEDGLSLCRRLRATGDTAVLMVTAKGDDIDRVVGLEVGADDYLAKPYNPRELVARVRAILRRTRGAPPAAVRTPREVMSFQGWRLDLGSRDLTAPDGRNVSLSGGEFDLLVCFLRHPQRVLSRDQLLDWTRGRNAAPYDRTIDVQLSRLRRKLDDPADGSGLIRTVRGGGYLFSAQVEPDMA
ncbi:MAG: response regulator [Phenylobacterium sp.]|uniref:response regulator n=1 Tax=Phenylobacterium sp. TaxID=1871053 RepID=UPI00391BDA9C